MDERLARLYRECRTLHADYIRDVLKLDGERAERVSKITGGIHADEAESLAAVVERVDPAVSVEVGLGFGFSALTICLSGKRATSERRHIIIDPHQTSYWRGGGMETLRHAGVAGMAELREDYSYRVLPELEKEGVKADFAFIDGWHTFDFVFVDFFYVDKLLREGGVVMFDDADWPSIRPVLRYAVTNLAYTVESTLPEKKPREAIDVELGLEGSCIALRKGKAEREREIFFHRPFH